MNKDDFKAEFEEHRKEINLEEEVESESLPSRVELHRKKRNPNRKSNHLMLNIILGLFTLIPVGILVYVISDFYSPDDKTSAQVEDSGIRFEIGNTAPEEEAAGTEKDPDEKTLAETTGDPEKETATPKVPTTESKPDPKPVSKPENKPAPPKTEQPEKKPAAPPVEKPKADPVPTQPSGKTHTVAQGETLYRISVNYYGSGSESSLEKIRRANGLSSNNIRAGQKLIIP
ncbi:LysM peptidoglycan-binding domain-containing protein [Sporosarcina sp. 179-K 3D1 HS]|uniref:LysM peptidoglycan-binding domain-containing protein n=1 Tax=Sporosarcina sp. 179-K 3D1 HS TaxID=3232169 RepID=UPI0039A34C35